MTYLEEIAAEFLCAEGEVEHGDRCDELDHVTDAELADRLVTHWRDRLDKVDFEEMVAAFGRVRAEDGEAEGLLASTAAVAPLRSLEAIGKPRSFAHLMTDGQ